MLTAPKSTATAWTEAETTAMNELCRITNSTVGNNAFFGGLPSIANAWFLNNARIVINDQFYAPRAGSIAMPYYVEGFFLRREDAQAWGMKIFLGLPISGSGNVALLRIGAGAFGEIALVEEQIENEDELVTGYRLRIELDLVFRTGI